MPSEHREFEAGRGHDRQGLQANKSWPRPASGQNTGQNSSLGGGPGSHMTAQAHVLLLRSLFLTVNPQLSKGLNIQIQGLAHGRGSKTQGTVRVLAHGLDFRPNAIVLAKAT